ncbi:MAG: WG repeat-containing protein [Candidatus Sericytochromatia bacterium]
MLGKILISIILFSSINISLFVFAEETITKKASLFIILKDNKRQIISKENNVLFSENFEEINDFSEGIAGIKINNKWGFIDKTGKVVIKPQFKDISFFSNGLAFVKKNYHWGAIDKRGKVAIPFKYKSSSYFQNGYAIIEDSNYNQGLINKKGKFIISAGKYSSIHSFNEGLAIVESNGKSGVIDKDNRVLVKLKYDSIEPFKEGLAIFHEYKKGYGIINKSGKVILQPQEKYNISPFSEGLSIIRINIKNNITIYGAIDKFGKIIIKPKYDFISDFINGLAEVRISKNGITYSGSINKKGEIVKQFVKYFPCPSPRYSISTDEKHYKEKINNENFFYDEKGGLHKSNGYDNVYCFDGDFAKIHSEGKWGFINKNNEFIIKPQYSEVVDFRNGFNAVIEDDFHSYIIDKNNIKIYRGDNYGVTPIYANNVTGYYQEVKKDNLILGRYGLSYFSGKRITKPIFDKMFEFSENLALVLKDAEVKYIDKTGKIVIDSKFQDAGSFSEGLALVSEKPKYGYINETGKIVIPPIFDNASAFYNKKAIVNIGSIQPYNDHHYKHIGGKNYLINTKGKIIKEYKDKDYDNYFNNVSKYRHKVLNIDNLLEIATKEIKKINYYTIIDQRHYISFNEGLSVIKTLPKYGYIDKTGKLIIKTKFQNAGNFSEGLAGIQINNEWGFIDKTGEIVIKPQFKSVQEFRSGRAIVELFSYKDDSLPSYNFIYRTGKLISKNNFYSLSDFNKDVSVARDYNNNLLIIDKNANIIKKFNYEETPNNSWEKTFKEGLLGLRINSRYGFVDINGNLVIPDMYEDVKDFSDGLAGVKTPNKWGFIDKNWNVIIKPQYDYVSNFKNGYSIFRLRGKYGVIDTKGKIIIEPIYDNIDFIKS